MKNKELYKQDVKPCECSFIHPFPRPHFYTGFPVVVMAIMSINTAGIIKVPKFSSKVPCKIGVGRNVMDWRDRGMEERSGKVLSSRVILPCRAEPEECKGCPGPAASTVSVTECPESREGGVALQNGYVNF